jgi:hypothetical protein
MDTPVIKPVIEIILAALCAAGLEVGLHYYFHPKLGRSLEKLPSYVAGSLAWVLPMLTVFALWNGWFYVLAALSILAVAGASTWLVNLHDRNVDLAMIAKDEQEQRALLERQLGVGHDQDVG